MSEQIQFELIMQATKYDMLKRDQERLRKKIKKEKKKEIEKLDELNYFQKEKSHFNQDKTIENLTILQNFQV